MFKVHGVTVYLAIPAATCLAREAQKRHNQNDLDFSEDNGCQSRKSVGSWFEIL